MLTVFKYSYLAWKNKRKAKAYVREGKFDGHKEHDSLHKFYKAKAHEARARPKRWCL